MEGTQMDVVRLSMILLACWMAVLLVRPRPATGAEGSPA
jgi:hypothetical protein